jgi:hypothetical protein
MPTPPRSTHAPLTASVDAIGDAVNRLESVLPRREDSAVLVELLEDDLREGLDAIADVEGHFHDVLEALRSEKLSPIALLDASDDSRVLERLDYLHELVGQLRRRVSKAAGKWVEG